MKAISKKSALNRMDWFDFLNYFIMLLVIVCTVFPLYYCAIVSISNGAAVTKGEVVFAPVGFDTTAYKVVFGNSQILRSYGNTIYYTLLGTAINIALTVLCAYPLSRPTLKGRKALNFLFMLTMFINGGMIPMYLQVKSLGMLDTVWSIVLPGAISTYNMIIMRSFFSSIPEAMHEAAEIDGADHFQTLFRVVLPLSQTILATLVLFYAVGHWNSYLSALLYLSDTKKMPLQMVIRKMVIDSDIANMTTANASSSSGTDTLLTENKLMYAYEQLFAYSGDAKWAERLEVLAFNGLPATLSDDMWAHQYDQLSNQIACYRLPGRPIYTTNLGDSNVFGLEPNYGCCTANFGQGWPKLALSAFMHRDNTIINVLPVPCELDAAQAHIAVSTDYPFKHSVTYEIDAREDFTFQFRIPSFAKNIRMNGQLYAGEIYSQHIDGNAHLTLQFTFEVEPHFDKTPGGLFAARCGSLVYAVPIKYKKAMREYEENKVERKYPYCDYEYYPESDWNYAYCASKLERVEHDINAIPFSSEHPPVTLRVNAQKIDWGLEDGYELVCSKWPQSLTPLAPPEEIELYPYGCAKLRMTELPMKNRQ